jgi:hypothetical protein
MDFNRTKLKSRTAPVAPRFAKRSKTKLSTSLQVSSETVEHKRVTTNLKCQEIIDGNNIYIGFRV